MAEWLYEDGIGENRAALVEDGTIVEARIELPEEMWVGAVLSARLATIVIPGRRGIARLANGGEVMLEPLSKGLTEGAALRVEIVRQPGLEKGRRKLAKARVTESSEQPGPTLLQRISGSEQKVERLATHGADRFEEAGWSLLLAEARTGEIAFRGGALLMSLTPAMTLFDVDGTLEPRDLATSGAAAAGRAIRRLGIAGSIGIDLPTLPNREHRQAAAAALDAALPQPFERTAVNGFGFLQLVRRRERASIPEIIQADPAAAAARALLRRAERSGGGGERVIDAAPAVVARMRPEWVEALARRIGAPVRLQEQPGLAISAGHVHSQFQ